MTEEEKREVLLLIKERVEKILSKDDPTEEERYYVLGLLPHMKLSA